MSPRRNRSTTRYHHCIAYDGRTEHDMSLDVDVLICCVQHGEYEIMSETKNKII